MENDHKEKMNQQLDAQIQELELRFNQFLKDLEEDFDFVPSVVSKGRDHHGDEISPELDNRLNDIEKKYASVDKKYSVVLTLTTLLMLSVLSYLGYVIFR